MSGPNHVKGIWIMLNVLDLELRQRRCGSLAAGLRGGASTSAAAGLTALEREDRQRRADASRS